MPYRVLLSLVVILGIADVRASAQTSRNAWHNWGVLPFSAVDIAVVEAGGRYVMYFTGSLQGQPRPGRAFSTDLKNWTVDDREFCSSTGLCALPDYLSALGHRPILRLPDGRYRLFRKSGNDIVSFLSTDALVWSREAGVRFTRDASQVWERAGRTLVGLAFLRLPDGRVRLYYAGGVVPGSEGTGPEYADCGGCLGILSAVSTDNGLSFVREPGVRVNPKVLGPSVPAGQFHVIGHSIVDADGGYRLYTTSWIDGAVTYFSRDGLDFTFEGRIPAIGSDIATVRMSDGRLWLVSSIPATARHAEGCPNGCNLNADDTHFELSHVMVLGPAPFDLEPARWNITQKRATLTVTGELSEPLSLNPILAKSACETTPERSWCPWHPEYYALSQAMPDRPTATVTYTGPMTRPDRTLDYTVIFEAAAGESRIVTAVVCMVTLGVGTTSLCQ